MRVGSGVASGMGGVPGATIAGLGEGAAQWMEGSYDETTPQRMAVEAAIGAIPVVGGFVRAGRPIISAYKSGLMNAAGDYMRQKAIGVEDVDPKSLILSTALGAGGGAIGGFFMKSPAAAAADRAPLPDVKPGVFTRDAEEGIGSALKRWLSFNHAQKPPTPPPSPAPRIPNPNAPRPALSDVRGHEVLPARNLPPSPNPKEIEKAIKRFPATPRFEFEEDTRSALSKLLGGIDKKKAAQAADAEAAAAQAAKVTTAEDAAQQKLIDNMFARQAKKQADDTAWIEGLNAKEGAFEANKIRLREVEKRRVEEGLTEPSYSAGESLSAKTPQGGSESFSTRYAAPEEADDAGDPFADMFRKTARRAPFEQGSNRGSIYAYWRSKGSDYEDAVKWAKEERVLPDISPEELTQFGIKSYRQAPPTITKTTTAPASTAAPTTPAPAPSSTAPTPPWIKTPKSAAPTPTPTPAVAPSVAPSRWQEMFGRPTSGGDFTVDDLLAGANTSGKKGLGSHQVELFNLQEDNKQLARILGLTDEAEASQKAGKYASPRDPFAPGTRASQERSMILSALESNPNRRTVARTLGMSPDTLYNKLRSYGVDTTRKVKAPVEPPAAPVASPNVPPAAPTTEGGGLYDKLKTLLGTSPKAAGKADTLSQQFTDLVTARQTAATRLLQNPADEAARAEMTGLDKSLTALARQSGVKVSDLDKMGQSRSWSPEVPPWDPTATFADQQSMVDAYRRGQTLLKAGYEIDQEALRNLGGAIRGFKPEDAAVPINKTLADLLGVKKTPSPEVSPAAPVSSIVDDVTDITTSGPRLPLPSEMGEAEGLLMERGFAEALRGVKGKAQRSLSASVGRWMEQNAHRVKEEDLSFQDVLREIAGPPPASSTGAFAKMIAEPTTRATAGPAPRVIQRGKGKGGLGKVLDPKGEKGFIEPELLSSLAGAGIGGAYGAATADEGKGLQGLTEGATLGALGGYGISKLPGMLRSSPQLVERLREPGGIESIVKEAVRELPNYQRFSYLADVPGLGANTIVASYGTVVWNALERIAQGGEQAEIGFRLLKRLNPISFTKGMFSRENFEEASDLVARGEMGRAESAIHGGQMTALQRHLTAPGVAMTMSDNWARKVLTAAGDISDDEARAITHTSQPYTKIGQGITNLSKGSWAGGMAIPFSRTPVNLVEQGLERTPVAGYLMNRYVKEVPAGWREQVAQQGLGAAIGYGSAKLGEITADENASPWIPDARRVRQYLSNAAGRYSLPASLGFAYGQSNQRRNPPGLRKFLGETRTWENVLPLPTIDAPIEWWKFLTGTGAVPRGAAPALVRRQLPEEWQSNRPTRSGGIRPVRVGAKFGIRSDR